MSHLDVPRIHFSGTFATDPSTNNNARSAYATALGAPVTDGWGPNGRHHFSITATVRRAHDASGAAFSNAAGDGAVGASVSTSGPGRLVDLDPDCQTFSQIWGLTIRVALAGAPAASFEGNMDTATLRDLWPNRGGGGLATMGGAFQSVLRGVTFTGTRAGAFDGLRAAASAAGGVLAVKFVVWGYDTGPMAGTVVGTIGPFTAASDELHFVGGRRLEPSTPASLFFTARAAAVATPSGPPPAYMSTPFKLDTARRKLVIDMGNTLPDADRVGSRLGRMHPAIRNGVGALVYLGPRMTYDTAHYLETAGVEEVDLTAAEVNLARANFLLLKVEDPAARVILTERPSGRYVDATELNVRLDPGASVQIQLVARELGAPKSGQALALFLLGTGGGAVAAAAQLSFPASVTTGADGRASVAFTADAAGAGNPRGALDGQYYLVGFYWGAIAPSNLRGVINVRVFDTFSAPAVPSWAQVQPAFTQYANLYPSMRGIFNLADRAIVENPAIARLLAASMRRSITAPNYMPVTRDLSQPKRDAMLRFLDDAASRGGP